MRARVLRERYEYGVAKATQTGKDLVARWSPAYARQRGGAELRPLILRRRTWIEHLVAEVMLGELRFGGLTRSLGFTCTTRPPNFLSSCFAFGPGCAFFTGASVPSVAAAPLAGRRRSPPRTPPRRPAPRPWMTREFLLTTGDLMRSMYILRSVSSVTDTRPFWSGPANRHSSASPEQPVIAGARARGLQLAGARDRRRRTIR